MFAIKVGAVILASAGLLYAKHIIGWTTKQMDTARFAYDVVMRLKNGKALTTPIRMYKRSALITYSNNSEKYQLSVPYDPQRALEMIFYKATLVNGSETRDITQEPGIPYLLAAKDIGGEYINIENQASGIAFTYYQAPMYAEELKYEE